jgi:hypothetical protein
MKFAARRVLYTVAIALAVIGLGLRLIPSPVSGSPAPPIAVADLRPGGDSVAAGADLAAFQPVVAANIFSQDRQPPAERYVPPELREQAAPPPPTQPTGGFRMRLFGVVVGPAGSVALIDADPRIPGAEVYRPGDMVGDSRLISVSDSTVVLEGPTGRRVLSLPSSNR